MLGWFSPSNERTNQLARRWNDGMSDELDEFNHLWDGSEPGWALFELPGGGQLIVNSQTFLAKIIEDDDLAVRVRQRMKDSGCQILKEPPAGSWKPPVS
jgi:hypothetical protein